MNIFELYLDKIKSIIVDLNKKNELLIPESFNGINAEIPPPKFDCDISTNVAMVLSKLNKTPSIELAEKLALAIKNNDKHIELISVAKPGFINIKLKPFFWSNFIRKIIENAETFGINEKEKKHNYLIEFVSDRPGHDLRYSLNSSKIRNSLKWNPETSFDDGLQKTINWIINNSAGVNISENILSSSPWENN